MSSAFERLQKIAEEKRLREKAAKPNLEVVANADVKALKTPVAKSQNISNLPSAPSAVRAVSAPSAGTTQPTAPEKDFAKVANSIVRHIPSGVFSGKSKQMYDYLYSLTRGAINPSRTIRISKSALMRGSGIKSTHTFYNNIRHLESLKLITSTRIDGEKGGNSYEVFLPEEIDDNLAQLAHLAQLGQLGQKLLQVPSAVSALTALGPSPVLTGVSATPKTSLKTNKNDDDRALAVFAQKFDEASRKLTGQGIRSNEAEKWGKLAEILILELELAARHTSGISSVPAFLTEVLRRRMMLSPEEKKQSGGGKFKPKNPNRSDVGKNYDDLESSYNPETGEYDIKPLSEAGKAKALELVLEARTEGGAFLDDLKKWYLPQDWEWLVSELEKEPQKERQTAQTPDASDNKAGKTPLLKK